MTLTEAIKISQYHHNHHHAYAADVIGQAERLGIEAMKRVLKARSYNYDLTKVLLPGETEE